MPHTTDEPPLRVVLAVGNPEQERQLLVSLSGSGLAVAARCLDGPSLLEHAAGPTADVVLASSALHRLSLSTLQAVRQAGLPLVLLTEPSDMEKYAGAARLLPAGTAGSDVAAALREAVTRGPFYPVRERATPGEKTPRSLDGARSDIAGNASQVTIVASGKGAPGKTTLAIGLAAALTERHRQVVLVDADLRGGDVAPSLDLDPRRGLSGLAFAWNGALAPGSLDEELQEGPGFLVLAGLERPERRAMISTELAVATMTALRQRFDEVIVDAGTVIPGLPSPATDSLLAMADRVLVVTGADLVSLWNTRAALRYLSEGLGLAREVLGLLLNRRQGREHYDGPEVARALDVPVLGVVPEDRRAATRALAQQLPMTVVGGGPSRALRDLAAWLTAMPVATAEAGRNDGGVIPMRWRAARR